MAPMGHTDPFRLLLLASIVVTSSCASGGSSGNAGTLRLAGDLDAGVGQVVAAGAGCGLRLVDARKDAAGRSAAVVLLDGASNPRPENTLVAIRLESGAEGVTVAYEAHPLAEYGMRPPDLRIGVDGTGCSCIGAARQDGGVRYSRGLAMGNVVRATRCLREALGSPAAP